MAVSFIGGGNRSTQRKPTTCRKSCSILYDVKVTNKLWKKCYNDIRLPINRLKRSLILNLILEKWFEIQLTMQIFFLLYRLMQHLHNFVNGLSPFTSSASIDDIPETGQKGLLLLKMLYQVRCFPLLENVNTWIYIDSPSVACGLRYFSTQES